MKPNKPSKAEQVLRVLKANIETGIHGFDLIPYGGLRYSARICDLRKQGYDIESVMEKRGKVMGCRYFLKE